MLDAADGELLVANDKGIGTTGYGVLPPPTNTAENSYAKEFGVSDFNTHQDLGTVSIVPIPNSSTLSVMTTQVYDNNHWDLAENIQSASGGKPTATPVAIPAKIGSPSLIKHVFVIIRENRTYDQMLGDVVQGNGDATLAVFGDGTAASDYGIGPDTPNAHTLVQRFPLLDNFYDPSRQSADGHNWITQAMAPYSDDIQSPDWLRDYPSNGGEALAYQKVGHLWDVAAKAGVSFKNYGEYIEYNTFLQRAAEVDHRATVDRLLQRHHGLRVCASAALQLQHGRLVLPAPERDEAHGPELPAVRSGHPRPVPLRCLVSGFPERRQERFGAPVGIHVDQLRPHRRPADRASHAGR